MGSSPQTAEFEIRIRLSKEAGERLADRAARSGRDVSAVASDLLEQAVSEKPGNGDDGAASQRVAAWQAWVAQMREWGTKNLPPGHVIDDSRESIYEGR